VLRHDDPVLQRLYAACAAYEGADPNDLERAQCVRYKPGQRFRPHFDGGNGMPRRATWLLYLNEGFEGGGTGFPELDLVIQPKAGTVVRFDDCDSRGRILWPSKHCGLPIASGVKYALNLWIRRPGMRSSAQSVAPATGTSKARIIS
jgi:prolyl 4-hydroxylase